MYIYEQKEWPHFTWDLAIVANLLGQVRYLQGRLLGRMAVLGFEIREEATFQTLTEEILKTSAIEGEKLDIAQVRSSLATHLNIKNIGINTALPVDRHVAGVVEMLLDATQRYAVPLSQARLCQWHRGLFPDGQSGFAHVAVGQWRTQSSGPMRIVSGPIGREKVHYEAPDYHRLKKEMHHFIRWFNAPSDTDSMIKAAIAHFWFVTIHPFEDGNGRIARAITDMLLARSEENQQRFYSMSSQIQKERHGYYTTLEACQKGTLDITRWIVWFLNCFQHAIEHADIILEKVLAKSRFWGAHVGESFNDRQRLIINRVLTDFFGKLNSSKWAKLTKCSQDTALRDITDLLNRNILVKDEAGGRSTNYQLRMD